MKHTSLADKKENKFDIMIGTLMYRHPNIAFGALFIGTPFFILIGLTISSSAVLLPISWMMGWI